MKRAYLLLTGVALGAAVSLPVTAWAAHGKVGLWKITVQSDVGRMPGMPDMSQMPPQARAKMQAMGMQANGNGMTVHHCMTAAEVASGKPVMSQNPDCKVSNVKVTGHSFSGDVICKGRMNGMGHVEFNFPSPEHYDGMETINVTVHGERPVMTRTMFSGRWISPNCGKYKN